MIFNNSENQISQKERYNARIAIIAAILGAILGAVLNATIQPVVSHYIYKTEQERMNPYELLNEGNLKYSKKDYLKCIDIYSNEKLKDYPEALNNLGFFYAQGIGVEKDMNKARDFFARAKEIDSNYTSGFAAVSVIDPQDIEVTCTAIVDSLKNGDKWTCLYINTLLAEIFPDKNYDYKTFLDMSWNEKIDALESGIRTEYEWNRGSEIKETAFYEKLVGADQSIKERIGIYEENGEVKPLYGTVTYSLYRKKSFNNLSIMKNGIEFKYTHFEKVDDN